MGIKGRPVKIVDYSTSKTGKHGHAKAHIVGIDIFTGKKLEENSPTTHTMDCPRVDRSDMMVTDCTGGFVNCLDDSGGEREFPLPEGELGETIQKRFDDGKDLLVTILTAMGETHVVAVKDDKE